MRALIVWEILLIPLHFDIWVNKVSIVKIFTIFVDSTKVWKYMKIR